MSSNFIPPTAGMELHSFIGKGAGQFFQVVGREEPLLGWREMPDGDLRPLSLRVPQDNEIWALRMKGDTARWFPIDGRGECDYAALVKPLYAAHDAREAFERVENSSGDPHGFVLKRPADDLGWNNLIKTPAPDRGPSSPQARKLDRAEQQRRDNELP